MHKPFNIALIFGGPSQERGISLNSARSVMDHLFDPSIEILPLYVDLQKNFYEISKSQLYSNTPSDFDFKLAQNAQKLSDQMLIDKLKSVDVAFPAIHGAFGEDGELQGFLEKHHIPYIGPSENACKNMFNKSRTASFLAKNGFDTLDSALLKYQDPKNEQIINEFFLTHNGKQCIIKPIAGGSSIGVFVANSPEEGLEKLQTLFTTIGGDAIIEPFCEGKEFTIIVLQNAKGKPVALIPSGIEMNYQNGEIFDFRRKYLPTNSVKSPCPANFSDQTIETIQEKAEAIFDLLGVHDFARLDGWLLNDGRIIFSDLNPISGMEQNSFIFQQCSRIGLSHKEALYSIVLSACKRYGLTPPKLQLGQADEERKKVHVLFGGKSAERQVSLMSGTNVWLKLRNSKHYDAEPYFLDVEGNVWHLPYTYTLNHTVEEVFENCQNMNAVTDRIQKFAQNIYPKWDHFNITYDPKQQVPKRYTFEQFIKHSQKENAFIFLGLHGGEGEGGDIQEKLEAVGQSQYNGSDPQAARLCMDKYLTGEAVKNLGDPDVLTALKRRIDLKDFISFNDLDFENYWAELKSELNSETFIIKPNGDGCSSGIIRLFSSKELQVYIELLRSKASYIEPNTFKNQPVAVEMSQDLDASYLIESFIETDQIYIQKQKLHYQQTTGWLELTVGILEKAGHYHSLAPSITISDNEVLSLEEKFQGGTGVNITPPPQEVISKDQVAFIRQKNEEISKALGIKNYSRNDIFFNVKHNKVLFIEANTLPGLTPSTVIYHQALVEDPPMNPTKFLETIIEYKLITRTKS